MKQRKACNDECRLLQASRTANITDNIRHYITVLQEPVLCLPGGAHTEVVFEVCH